MTTKEMTGVPIKNFYSDFLINESHEKLEITLLQQDNELTELYELKIYDEKIKQCSEVALMLLSFNNVPQVKLTGLRFHEIDFTEYDLKNVTFENCDFIWCVFCDISDTKFIHCDAIYGTDKSIEKAKKNENTVLELVGEF